MVPNKYAVAEKKRIFKVNVQHDEVILVRFSLFVSSALVRGLYAWIFVKQEFKLRNEKFSRYLVSRNQMEFSFPHR